MEIRVAKSEIADERMWEDECIRAAVGLTQGGKTTQG